MAYTENHKGKWWKIEKPYEELMPLVKRLDDSYHMETLYGEWLSLYLNRSYGGIKPGEATVGRSLFRNKRDRVVVNALQNIVETLVSRICPNRPRPRFLTTDGGWNLKNQSKKLEKFVDGVINQNKAYDQTAMAFRDCCWSGTGFIKVYPDGNSIKVERVFPGEILVDEQGCLYSEPRAIFQRKYVPVEVLKEKFWKHRHDIDRAIDGRSGRLGSDGNIIDTDLIECVEAWHLPSGPKSKDGLHVVAIDNATLLKEAYHEDKFPFVAIRFSETPMGFYGQGLIELGQPVQQEINKLINRIQESMNIFATSWLIAEEGSINKDHVTNHPGTILWKKPGHPDPKVQVPPSMNGEVFGHANWLFEKIHEVLGVSQLSAGGQRPPSIESGVALRTLQDIESMRFGMLHRAWEQFHLSLAETVIMVAKGTYNYKEKDFEVRYTGKKHYETIKWSEVDLDEQAYVIQLWPTNILPSTPAGKLATVQELLGAGLIDEKVAKALLDFPDLERAQSLETSSLDNIDNAIEQMLYEGVYTEPKPYQDLQLGIMRVGQELLRAELENAPEDRMELLKQWLEDASALLMPPEPPPPPPGAAMGLPPGLPPGAEGLPPGMPPLPPEALAGLPEEGPPEPGPEIDLSVLEG